MMAMSGGSCWVLSRNLLMMTGIAFLSGCSGGDADTKPTAKASGKVSFDGKPVTGGILIFSPIGTEKNSKPGKTGQATIKSDGTFTVTTYHDGDGAVLGPHRILFQPPAAAAPAAAAGGHSEAPAPSPFDGLSPKTPEVTIAKGDNKIEVELVKGTATPAAPQ